MSQSATASISPELQFLAACSYIPATPLGLDRQKQQLQAALRRGYDAKSLPKAISRHRIFVIAEHVLRQQGMQDLLRGSLRSLQQRAGSCRLQNLRLLAASHQVERDLSASGIEHRFLKGPRLSQKIYGDPGCRHSKDLDLFVRPADTASAVEVLQEHGWVLHKPGMWLKGGVHRRLAQHRHRHLQLFHREKQIGIELHWRIEAGIGRELEDTWWNLWNNSPEVTPAEFLHLCMHGAVHAWSRLKWLGDIAAIVDRQPGIWAASGNLCAALGLELAAAQTKLLLHLLYGGPAAPGHSPVEATRMAVHALGEMCSSDPNRTPAIGTWWKRRVYFTQLLRRYPLPRRWTYRFVTSLFEDTALMRVHPALLAAMPFARAAGLFRRYILKRS